MFTDKTKADMIKETIFSDPFIRSMILLGFIMELFQFAAFPSMNHQDFVRMQNTMYNCAHIHCSDRPDFVIFELVLRMFVGIAIINNIVLLSSILSDHMHTETSLTNISKSMNAIFWIVLLFAIGLDLRIDDDQSSDWAPEYTVVNWIWIIVHLVGIVIVLKIMCYPLYELKHASYVFIVCIRKGAMSNSTVVLIMKMNFLLMLLHLLVSRQRESCPGHRQETTRHQSNKIPVRRGRCISIDCISFHFVYQCGSTDII